MKLRGRSPGHSTRKVTQAPLKHSLLENPMSLFAPARLIASVSIAVLFLVIACDEGGEGDRCNPDLSHNDCNSGLICTIPSTCVEAYCCPADPSTSSNPYCNGMGCPAAPMADAGEPDAGETLDSTAAVDALDSAATIDALDSTLAADAQDSAAAVDAQDSATAVDAQDSAAVD